MAVWLGSDALVHVRDVLSPLGNEDTCLLPADKVVCMMAATPEATLWKSPVEDAGEISEMRSGTLKSTMLRPGVFYFIYWK